MNWEIGVIVGIGILLILYIPIRRGEQKRHEDKLRRLRERIEKREAEVNEERKADP